MKILIIDNYDSFTYNLADLVFRETQYEPMVVYNDQISYEDIVKLPIDGIIISAGPGRPENNKDLGIARDIILNVPKPVLGVCLGMQGMVYFHGGKISYAAEQMHGRSSVINHRANGLFADIPQKFTAMRYHSLVVTSPLPTDFECTAWTNHNTVMAVQHRSKALYGVQFHPESIRTEFGLTLLRNFCKRIDPGYRTAPPDPVMTSIASSIKRPSHTHVINVNRYHRWIDPCLVFSTLFADAENCFWLDSNDPKHPLSNVSYMGDSRSSHSHIISYKNQNNQLSVNAAVKSNQHIFEYMDTYLRQHYCDSTQVAGNFVGGFVGWFGYELCNGYSTNSAHTSDIADAAFIFVDRFLCFDHKLKTMTFVEVEMGMGQSAQKMSQVSQWLASSTEKLDAIKPEANKISTPSVILAEAKLIFTQHDSKDAYLESIRLAKEKIREGESYEICLTNRLQTPLRSTGYEVYQILRDRNPAPFSSYIKIADVEVVCSSPERFLAINRQREVSSKPIKGTISRDSDPQTDAANKQFLQSNIKDSAENLMIVDLLRNDLTQVCQYGSITVPTLLEVESFARVHQLVSTITAKMAADKSTIDCIKACFPGGSMTGAPKRRTMEILSQLETHARGIYSGGLGYLSLNGCCDLNIIIRTIIVHQHTASIGCGGAIVALSDAEQEYAEILLKASSLIEAIVMAEKGRCKQSDYKIRD